MPARRGYLSGVGATLSTTTIRVEFRSSSALGVSTSRTRPPRRRARSPSSAGVGVCADTAWRDDHSAHAAERQSQLEHDGQRSQCAGCHNVERSAQSARPRRVLGPRPRLPPPLPGPSHRRPTRGKLSSFRVASTNTTAVSGMAIFSAMPGKPPPAPTSTRRAGDGCFVPYDRHEAERVEEEHADGFG